MDKTQQLLDSLKDTVNATSSSASSALAPAPGGGLDNALGFVNAVGSSLINNPLFYVKVVAVLILTVIIVMVSISLITDG